MVGRTVSGAHYGLRDWLAQRVSAVVMAAYSLFIGGIVLTTYPLHYADWQMLFSQPWVRYFSLLFFLGLYLHAWVGVRDVLMDYVHSVQIRLTLQVAVILSLMIYVMWTVNVLWGGI